MEKFWQWCEDFAVVTDAKVPDESTNYLVVGNPDAISDYADSIDVPVKFNGYQVGVLDFSEIQDLGKILNTARDYYSQGKAIQAYYLYKILFARTVQPMLTDTQRAIHSEACIFFARMAADFGRNGTAYDWYKRAIAAEPKNAEHRIEMIVRTMCMLGLVKSASIEAKRATEIAPDNPWAWRALGNIESMMVNEDGVRIAYDKELEVSNRSTIALIDKVFFFIDTEGYDEADALCDEILLRKEDDTLHCVYHCKGLILARCGKHEEAIEVYKKALECSNADSVINFHLSLSLQALGRYREAWKNLSNSRTDNRSNLTLFVPLKRFEKPLFAMQPPPAVVHIHTEAGAGDNLALMRYLPLLRDKGYTVRLEAIAELIKLAKDSFEGIEVVKNAKDWPGTFGIDNLDYHLPMLELPHVFDTEVDTVPWYGPYLKADKELVKQYEQCRGKIGILWSSGIRTTGIWVQRYGKHKSLPVNLIQQIIDSIGPDKFVSLQAGLPRYEPKPDIEDPLPVNPTWADTAALVETLDLIITPDTAVAHLVGAMGKPVWLMMHGHNNTWHFMCERPGASWNTSSPWYPTMRIFRQKVPDDWSNVIDDIVKELKLRCSV